MHRPLKTHPRVTTDSCGSSRVCITCLLGSQAAVMSLLSVYVVCIKQSRVDLHLVLLSLWFEVVSSVCGLCMHDKYA